ncbi:MAG: ComF family protein [Gammaproteobacteria bacterium]|jgi:ComF family protein
MTPAGLARAIGRGIDCLFAPGLCLACGAALDGDDSLCTTCRGLLRRVPNPCFHCGQPNPADGPACPACLKNPPRWQRLTAPLQYRGLAREYLLQLKFREALYLAKTLCRYCDEPFLGDRPRPEVLLPVPLHRERWRERGYNQALEIAAVWSRMFGIPVDRYALERLRPTASQSGLGATARARNQRGAFGFYNRRGWRHVAIVDDIVTTGSTANEITRCLHRGGVEYVEVWALARVYRR